MMDKISTLIGTFLVQWLAMSAGTWAAGNENTRPPTEEELGAWLNVLRGAEVALQADKYETAMAMVAGVSARLDATNMPDKEKQAKFKELLKAAEVAVEEDNKVKAIVLINAIGETFEEHHGQLRVGRERYLHEQAHAAHHPNPAAHHPIPAAHHPIPVVLHHPIPVVHHPIPVDHHPNPAAHHPIPVVHHPNPVDTATDRNFIGQQLRVAYDALAAHDGKKAESIIQGFYHMLNNNKDLASGEKAAVFLHAIHESEKYIKADASDLAELALRSAGSALQLNHLREGYV